MDDPVIWTMVGCLEFVGAFFLIIVAFQLVVASKSSNTQ